MRTELFRRLILPRFLLPKQAGRTAAADAAALALFAVGVARCVIVQAPAFVEALRAAMMMAAPEPQTAAALETGPQTEAVPEIRPETGPRPAAASSMGEVANAAASSINASSVETSSRSSGGADSDGSANKRRPRAL